MAEILKITDEQAVQLQLACRDVLSRIKNMLRMPDALLIIYGLDQPVFIMGAEGTTTQIEERLRLLSHPAEFLADDFAIINDSLEPPLLHPSIKPN